MKLLDNIYQQVLSEEVSDDTGLLNGKLGKTIFLIPIIPTMQWLRR